MSLLADLATARQHLARHANAEHATTRVASYERISRDLTGWAANLAQVRRQCEALHAVDAKVIAPAGAIKQLADALAALQEKIADDPEGDLLLEVAAKAWTELPTATGQLRKAAEDCYTELRRSLIGTELPPLFQLLSEAKDFPQDKLTEVENIDRELAQLPEAPPEKATVLRTAQLNKAKRTELVAELEQAVPTEVRGLLAKIADRTATLDDLQPEQLGWLQDKGLARGFAVRHATAEPPLPPPPPPFAGRRR